MLDNLNVCMHPNSGPIMLILKNTFSKIEALSSVSANISLFREEVEGAVTAA